MANIVNYHNYYYQDENSEWVRDNGGGKRIGEGRSGRGGGRGASDYAGGRKACYSCGKTDHLQRDCPESPDAGESDRVLRAYKQGLSDAYRDIVEQNGVRGLWIGSSWFELAGEGRSAAVALDRVEVRRPERAKFFAVGADGPRAKYFVAGTASGAAVAEGAGMKGKGGEAKVEKSENKGFDRPIKREREE